MPAYSRRIRVELGGERRVGHRLLPGGGQLVEGGEQRLGHEPAARTLPGRRTSRARRRRSGWSQVGHASTPVIARDGGLGVAVRDQRLADEDDAGALADEARRRRRGRRCRTRRPGPRSSGTSGASRPNVSSSTSRVFRLRALTPTSSAPRATRPLGLGLVVDLDQHGQAELAGLVVQPAQRRRRRARPRSAAPGRRRRRGPRAAGSSVTMKSLRSSGDVDRGAHRAQVVEAAAEAALLGEHADRGGTAARRTPRPARPGRGCRRGRPCSGCAA